MSHSAELNTLYSITSHSDALDSTFYLEESDRLLPHIGNSKVIPQNRPASLFIPDMVEVEKAWNKLPDTKEARDQFLVTWDQRYNEIKRVCRFQFRRVGIDR